MTGSDDRGALSPGYSSQRSRPGGRGGPADVAEVARDQAPELDGGHHWEVKVRMLEHMARESDARMLALQVPNALILPFASVLVPTTAASGQKCAEL